jgi:tRNA(Ile)-lysidine synthase
MKAWGAAYTRVSPGCAAGCATLRPWLQVSPAAIAAYARRHRLRHVEDDSNADRRFARNRLRLEVWPALSAAFGQAEAALAAAATWAREARQCADELASIDLARVADERGLDIAAWSRLSPVRRSNALRAWLKAQAGVPAAAAAVQRLLLELPGRSPARWQVGDFVLRRYRGCLRCHRAETPPGPTASSARIATLSLTRAGTFAAPGWGGRLRVRRVDQGGVPMSSLTALRLAERAGGEQFQPAFDRPARSLKKQFQANAVPAWERAGPLIYCGEQLLYVPGLGTDVRALAAPDVRQATLEWLVDDC